MKIDTGIHPNELSHSWFIANLGGEKKGRGVGRK